MLIHSWLVMPQTIIIQKIIEMLFYVLILKKGQILDLEAMQKGSAFKLYEGSK